MEGIALFGGNSRAACDMAIVSAIKLSGVGGEGGLNQAQSLEEAFLLGRGGLTYNIHGHQGEQQRLRLQELSTES